MTKILIVDDEKLILYSLSKTLGQGGAEVTAVSNGKDALSEIQRVSYDICFLDVQLPDANGLELMKTFRKLSPLTHIIIMTALCLTDGQQTRNPEPQLPLPAQALRPQPGTGARHGDMQQPRGNRQSIQSMIHS